MRRSLVAFVMLVSVAAMSAQAAEGKVLYVYDEVNDQSTPYIQHFREAFAAAGIAFDEAVVAEMGSKDLSKYEIIVVHGMVMAFASKSPVRDWLNSKPILQGKKVSLFVTANRWFLEKLFGQLKTLFVARGATFVDAVSMATKNTDDAAEGAAVRALVSKLK
jgi:hypothetical protein